MVEGNRLQNPNSLANLSKGNAVHHDYGKNYCIPQDKVDKMFLLLAKDMPLTHVAKEVGITYDTAKKYFEKGDPRRGIQPLQRRLTMYQNRKSEQFTEAFLERQEELLTLVRDQIALIREKIKDSIDTKKFTYTALEKMIKLELSLMGRPDKVSSGVMLTAEDIKMLEGQAKKDE